MPSKDAEKRKLAQKAYRERHRERINLKKRAYRKLHSKKIEARKKQLREANPEKTVAQYRAWRNRRKEKRLEEKRKRRAASKNSAVYLTTKEKEAMLLLEKTRRELQAETGRKYQIDHILPICHGGIHHPVNLRILEASENGSKQDKILPEAVALAPEHFRLYSERISPERAWQFVVQLGKSLGLNEEDLQCLITGKPLKSKPTLEDFLT